jgi:hypothetical protein
MNVLAIYYVNQHLNDLQDEARRNRLVSRPARPSRLRRFAGALRSAFGAGSTDVSPTAAAAA